MQNTAPVSKDLAAKIWRRNLRLTKGQKAVLVAIMDHTDATNISYPSLTLIAAESGYDKTRASRYVDEIAALGIITKSKRDARHGHYQRNQYQVNVGFIPPETATVHLPPGQLDHLPPGQTKVFHSEGFTSGKSVSQTDGHEAVGMGKTKTETDPVNSVTQNQEKTSTSECCAAGVPPAADPAVAKAIAESIKQWEAMCQAPMPGAKTIDKVYLRHACDAIRAHAPLVKLKMPLPKPIFSRLSAIYDERGAEAINWVKGLLGAYDLELETVTEEECIALVLDGKPPARPYHAGCMPNLSIDHPQYAAARKAWRLLKSEAEELAWRTQYMPDLKPVTLVATTID